MRGVGGKEGFLGVLIFQYLILIWLGLMCEALPRGRMFAARVLFRDPVYREELIKVIRNFFLNLAMSLSDNGRKRRNL
ncbi:hypothetical protein PUN28_008306 [Cardiocondyla obscurior]|uniref:Uncharacterized protein n=1 Tax=Cardiocondyla obscurior TaxID=286306 RepID=A0AAW2G362_9HYME